MKKSTLRQILFIFNISYISCIVESDQKGVITNSSNKKVSFCERIHPSKLIASSDR